MPNFSYDSVNTQLQKNLREAKKDLDFASFQVEHFTKNVNGNEALKDKFTRERDTLLHVVELIPTLLQTLPANCTDCTLIKKPEGNFSAVTPRDYFRVLPVFVPT